MKLPTGLTKVELAALGEVVDSPHWRAIVKLIALKQMEIAQTGLMNSNSMEMVKYNQGQVQILKWLEETIRAVHKKQQTANTKETLRNE